MADSSESIYDLCSKKFSSTRTNYLNKSGGDFLSPTLSTRSYDFETAGTDNRYENKTGYESDDDFYDADNVQLEIDALNAHLKYKQLSNENNLFASDYTFKTLSTSNLFGGRTFTKRNDDQIIKKTNLNTKLISSLSKSPEKRECSFSFNRTFELSKRSAAVTNLSDEYGPIIPSSTNSYSSHCSSSKTSEKFLGSAPKIKRGCANVTSTSSVKNVKLFDPNKEEGECESDEEQSLDTSRPSFNGNINKTTIDDRVDLLFNKISQPPSKFNQLVRPGFIEGIDSDKSRILDQKCIVEKSLHANKNRISQRIFSKPFDRCELKASFYGASLDEMKTFDNKYNYQKYLVDKKSKKDAELRQREKTGKCMNDDLFRDDEEILETMPSKPSKPNLFEDAFPVFDIENQIDRNGRPWFPESIDNTPFDFAATSCKASAQPLSNGHPKRASADCNEVNSSSLKDTSLVSPLSNVYDKGKLRFNAKNELQIIKKNIKPPYKSESNSSSSTLFNRQAPFELNYEKMLSLQLKKHAFKSWCDLDAFSSTIIGAFVRLEMTCYGRTAYCIVCILNLVDNKAYEFDGILTTKHLFIEYPDHIKKVVTIDRVSDENFTKDEYKLWHKSSKENNARRLNADEYEAKRLQIQEALRIPPAQSTNEVRHSAVLGKINQPYDERFNSSLPKETTDLNSNGSNSTKTRKPKITQDVDNQLFQEFDNLTKTNKSKKLKRLIGDSTSNLKDKRIKSKDSEIQSRLVNKKTESLKKKSIFSSVYSSSLSESDSNDSFDDFKPSTYSVGDDAKNTQKTKEKVTTQSNIKSSSDLIRTPLITKKKTGRTSPSQKLNASSTKLEKVRQMNKMRFRETSSSEIETNSLKSTKSDHRSNKSHSKHQTHSSTKDDLSKIENWSHTKSFEIKDSLKPNESRVSESVEDKRIQPSNLSPVEQKSLKGDVMHTAIKRGRKRSSSNANENQSNGRKSELPDRHSKHKKSADQDDKDDHKKKRKRVVYSSSADDESSDEFDLKNNSHSRKSKNKSKNKSKSLNEKSSNEIPPSLASDSDDSYETAKWKLEFKLEQLKIKYSQKQRPKKNEIKIERSSDVESLSKLNDCKQEIVPISSPKVTESILDCSSILVESDAPILTRAKLDKLSLLKLNSFLSDSESTVRSLKICTDHSSEDYSKCKKSSKHESSSLSSEHFSVVQTPSQPVDVQNIKSEKLTDLDFNPTVPPLKIKIEKNLNQDLINKPTKSKKAKMKKARTSDEESTCSATLPCDQLKILLKQAKLRLKSKDMGSLIKKLTKLEDQLYRDRIAQGGVNEIDFKNLKRQKISFNIESVRYCTSYRKYLMDKY